ncbi:MAG: hypothetical protein ACYDEA_02405 [Candidatus Dormibacteria bacterium]
MAPLLHVRRIYRALLAGALFLVALGISWTQGGNHLWLQGVAMVLAALAFLLAGLAARAPTGKAG